MSRHLLSSSAIRRAVARHYRAEDNHGAVKLPFQAAKMGATLFSWHQVGLRRGVTSLLHALSADDRQQITELCFRFDAAVNNHDHPGAVALFSPEGTLHTPKGSSTGHEALLQYFKAVEPMAKGNRHLSANVLVGGGPDRATATSYRLLHKAACPTVLLASGTIHDIVEKVDGEWKFVERRFQMDPPAAPPAA